MKLIAEVAIKIKGKEHGTCLFQEGSARADRRTRPGPPPSIDREISVPRPKIFRTQVTFEAVEYSLN